jgi:hypothetical protein
MPSQRKEGWLYVVCYIYSVGLYVSTQNKLLKHNFYSLRFSDNVTLVWHRVSMILEEAASFAFDVQN